MKGMRVVCTSKLLYCILMVEHLHVSDG